MLFIALFLLAVIGVLFARHRGHSFHAGTARALAFLAGSLGLVLAVFLANHAVATARDDVHGVGDVRWTVVIAVAAAVAGFSLLVGTVRWETRIAWRLRLGGFLGLLLATLGSLSWVLPFFAPLALLAIPSLMTDRDRSGRASQPLPG